jgi:hypothetical protein
MLFKPRNTNLSSKLRTRRSNSNRGEKSMRIAFVFGVLAIVCNFVVWNLRFADVRQLYAMPFFHQGASTIELTTRPAVEAIVESRQALPSKERLPFKDVQFNVIRNQIRELAAFELLLRRRALTPGYAQIIKKDLADQARIGALGDLGYTTVMKHIRELNELSITVSGCVSEASQLREALQAGLADQTKAAQTMIASTRNLMERMKGNDLVSRCDAQSTRAVDLTEQLVLDHDRYVDAFNQLASRQQSIRAFVTALSSFAAFLFGAAARDGIAMLWKKIGRPTKLTWRSRFLASLKRPVIKRKNVKKFWQ